MTKGTKVIGMTIKYCSFHSFFANSALRNLLGGKNSQWKCFFVLVFTPWWKNLFLKFGNIFLIEMEAVNVAWAIALWGFWLTASEVSSLLCQSVNFSHLLLTLNQTQLHKASTGKNLAGWKSCGIGSDLTTPTESRRMMRGFACF